MRANKLLHPLGKFVLKDDFLKQIIRIFPLCLILLTACQGEKNQPAADGKQGKDAKKETTATATTTAGTSTAAPAGEREIIEVNGEKVYESELMLAVESLPRNMQGALASEQGRRALGEEMVRMKLLEQEGRRLGLEKDPEVQRQMKLVEGNIIAEAAMKKIAGEPTDAELRKIYDREKKNIEALQLRQIVVAYAGGAVPARMGAPLDEAAAKQRAAAIAERARKGEDFVALVRSESDHPEAAQDNGGLLYRRGSAPPEVENVLFALKNGEVSNPVKTPLGYHVFKLVGRETKSFDEVKPMLIQQASREKMETILADLKKKAKVEYNDEYFGKPDLPKPPAAAKK